MACAAEAGSSTPRQDEDGREPGLALGPGWLDSLRMQGEQHRQGDGTREEHAHRELPAAVQAALGIKDEEEQGCRRHRVPRRFAAAGLPVKDAGGAVRNAAPPLSSLPHARLTASTTRVS